MIYLKLHIDEISFFSKLHITETYLLDLSLFVSQCCGDKYTRHCHYHFYMLHNLTPHFSRVEGKLYLTPCVFIRIYQSRISYNKNNVTKKQAQWQRVVYFTLEVLINKLINPHSIGRYTARGKLMSIKYN